MSPIQTGGRLKPKTQTLDEAWAELTRLHPELAALPDPDRRPPNEESLDELQERGDQFPETLGDWWAHANGTDRTLAWTDNLPEPKRTICLLFLRGFTETEVVEMLKWQGTYRTRQNVTLVFHRFKRKLLINNTVK